MSSGRLKHLSELVLVFYVEFVFLQSLYFKFTNSPETMHIFNTISAWMDGISVLSLFSGLFMMLGGYLIGTAELISCALLLFKRTRHLGAFLALMIMSGAIFFHLATPLGVNVQGDNGLLFIMAVGVWLSSAIILCLYIRKLQPRTSDT